MSQLDKDKVEAPRPKYLYRPTLRNLLWEALRITCFMTVLAPVYGVGARLWWEALMWGWNLLGFAN